MLILIFQECSIVIVSSVLIILASATASAATAVVPADPLDKVKCVRESVTGSLVQTKKVCHTEREWRAIRSNAEEEARRITRPGSPNVAN
jgi:hypothetical protein